MTKSLERLQRLAKRKGLPGDVLFQPETAWTDGVERPEWRYSIVIKGFGAPLGKSAQAARFALNHMAGGKDG